MKYTKKDIQQRVLQHGKPLPLSKFSWDENTNTFISNEDNLVIDFRNIDYSTVMTGNYSTVNTGDDSTVTTGDSSTVTTKYRSTVTTGDHSTVTAGVCSTVTTEVCSTVTTGCHSTVTTGSFSTVTAGDKSTVRARRECCFHYVNGYRSGMVILMNNDTIKTFRNNMLIKKEDSEKFTLNGEWHDIFDNVLSKIIAKKGNVYKVVNDGEIEESYVVTDGQNFAHGKTIRDAKNDLIFKIGQRDTSAFKGLTIESIVDFETAVKAYRNITGSCESMTKSFALSNKKDSYTIQEVIDLTEGQFNHNLFKEFFNR